MSAPMGFEDEMEASRRYNEASLAQAHATDEKPRFIDRLLDGPLPAVVIGCAAVAVYSLGKATQETVQEIFNKS